MEFTSLVEGMLAFRRFVIRVVLIALTIFGLGVLVGHFLR
jgi:hypothetical protein